MNKKIPFPFIPILFVLIACTPSILASQEFRIADGQFQFGGKGFQIISGEMHYLRIPPEYWRDRLKKARSMGLNTVATYVFWNAHEPRQGEFNFSGGADVALFVKTAEEESLYVILRPGPYACAEWEFGGYPAWLLKEPPVKVRGMDERFMKACEGYLKRLGRELAGLQNTRGGPIIMVQVENEYGSFGSDKVYEGKIRDMIREAGFDVPLFTADGPSQMPAAYLPDVLPAVNGAVGEEIFDAIRAFRPQGPFFVAEFYPGWLDHWGEPHAHVDVAKSAAELEWILSRGISVNLYMFHGGTNFGFMNGANYGGRYQPQPTSYDYDAPLDEAGYPTEKYFKFREVIARHLPEGKKIPGLALEERKIEIPQFTLDAAASIFDGLPPPVSSPHTLSMEDIGQAYGYILYRTRLAEAGKGTLAIKELRDYASIFINGKKIGSLDRRHKQNKLEIDVTSAPSVLDILVENGGRINYGRQMLDNRKGITESVTLDAKELTGWEIFPLPMDNVSGYHFSLDDKLRPPALYRGTFTIGETGNTYLNMRRWSKGCVWVNSHNLGRFWYVGPQQTLYLPGAWLVKGTNEIVVLELEESLDRSVRGLKEPILNELWADNLKPPLPPRAQGKVLLDPSDMVARGSFERGDAPQDIKFGPLIGRYFCLETLSSQAGDPFASISEIYLFDGRDSLISRDKWSVYAVDSEELSSEDGRAENAFDGDPETIWHTLWGSSQPKHPHYIVIDAGSQVKTCGLRYLGRRTDAPGKIKDFRFYVRQDPFVMNK